MLWRSIFLAFICNTNKCCIVSDSISLPLKKKKTTDATSTKSRFLFLFFPLEQIFRFLMISWMNQQKYWDERNKHNEDNLYCREKLFHQKTNLSGRTLEERQASVGKKPTATILASTVYLLFKFNWTSMCLAMLRGKGIKYPGAYLHGQIPLVVVATEKLHDCSIMESCRSYSWTMVLSSHLSPFAPGQLDNMIKKPWQLIYTKQTAVVLKQWKKDEKTTNQDWSPFSESRYLQEVNRPLHCLMYSNKI